MSKTYYAIADCKHGIKPQFCLACAKERIIDLLELLRHVEEYLIPEEGNAYLIKMIRKELKK